MTRLIEPISSIRPPVRYFPSPSRSARRGCRSAERATAPRRATPPSAAGPSSAVPEATPEPRTLSRTRRSSSAAEASRHLAAAENRTNRTPSRAAGRFTRVRLPPGNSDARGPQVHAHRTDPPAVVTTLETNARLHGELHKDAPAQTCMSGLHNYAAGGLHDSLTFFVGPPPSHQATRTRRSSRPSPGP